jgi:hypothetical protein
MVMVMVNEADDHENVSEIANVIVHLMENVNETDPDMSDGENECVMVIANVSVGAVSVLRMMMTASLTMTMASLTMMMVSLMTMMASLMTMTV